MKNEGGRLNLVFGKRIKGESLKDKRKVLGRGKRTFGSWRGREERNQRENSKKRKQRGI